MQRLGQLAAQPVLGGLYHLKMPAVDIATIW
jgi:hypothetical protein